MSFLRKIFGRKSWSSIPANSQPESNQSKSSYSDVYAIANKHEKVASRLSSDPNLHFIVRENDLERALKHPDTRLVEMALKKAALYADKAIILTEAKTLYSSSGGSPTAVEDFWGDSTISQRLRELYHQFNSTPSFGSTFYFIPEKVVSENSEWDEDEWISAVPIAVFDFASIYKNRLGVDMSLTDPSINSHIFETLQCAKDEVSVLNVWLPHLANIPLDVLLNLRVDEADSFSRFQYALRKLIADSGEMDAETKVKELFQYVDYEVRSFENKMNQIRRTRILNAYETVLGASIMGLSLAIPTDIAMIVSSTIGVYEGKEFISHLFREREQVYALKASDFYVPWLCTKKAKEM